MSAVTKKEEKKPAQARLSAAEAEKLMRQKAELSSRILALKAESAKIAALLIAAGRDVSACW